MLPPYCGDIRMWEQLVATYKMFGVTLTLPQESTIPLSNYRCGSIA